MPCVRRPVVELTDEAALTRMWESSEAMVTRPYRGWDDLRAMQAVCSARLLASPGRAAAHPGDIAWWVGWPPKSAERLAGAYLLWEEDDEAVGFATMPHEGDLSVFVSPALADTEAAADFEDEALAWASRGDAPVRWTEFEDETAAVERWRGRGFRPTHEGYMNLTRTLDDVVDEGGGDDRVQPVGDDDVEDRASITHAAFGNRKPFAQYASEYAGFRASPAYPFGWDLLLRDGEDRAAACCIAWPDPISHAGTFEPVATHPDMHRRGFGRALLLDGLRRFAAAGMTYAIVGVDVENSSAEALYHSVGFQSDRVLRAYARP
jgi:ribosomal protein S18 acetylase RimI-like enzyme